ncbi:PIR Superfamily Protein, partial [Plasmodium ovale curtisi]
MYKFCSNYPYYEMVVENMKNVEVSQEIINACKSFTSNICSFGDSTAEKICKNFFCINLDEEIGNMVEYFISSKKTLGKHLHVIDPGNLENMELLCELYDHERNILNVMRDEVYEDKVQNPCSYYTEKSHETYKKAMNKCLNDNADFYKALKDFKISYIAIEQEAQDIKDCRSSEYFHLPEYDPVLGKQKNIIVGKILRAPLILSFVVPLLYK